MAKQQILLVDADSSSARLLEVSLRSAGFTVATADSAEAALAKLEHGTPDLILTDTALPKADGFSFVRKLRSRPESAEVPVVFLTEQGALEDKLRGLELGVDDYLAKPIFVREVVTRVQLLLARKRQRIAPEPARTRFSGSLEDVAVVDLLQTIAVSGKSGVASVRRGDREAWLYFDRGQVIDAEVGDLRGEEAVYRTISWTTGSFDLEFRPCDRAKVIDAPYQALLMEGLRRVDELGRIAEQLPPEDAVIDLDHAALASRLNEIPDELNAILRLIDGKRTLLDLIDASPFDDLSTLTVLSKFYFEGLISSTDPVAEGSERPLAAGTTSSAPPSDAPRDIGEVATLVPSSPPTDAPRGPDSADLASPGFASADLASGDLSSPELASADRGARDIGQVETLVPPSRSTPAGALPTVPPARLPQTSPPSTVPAELEPPREARRETPAPVTARAAAPAPVMEGKLTPKGIVNVGEHGSIPAKPAASPFHVVAPQPRRSPIPMPDGSLRVTGAGQSGALQASGAEAEELRQTRTSLGLSAAPMQRPAIAREPVVAAPAAEAERPSPVVNAARATAPAAKPPAAAAPVTTPPATPAVTPAAVAPAAVVPAAVASSAPTARNERAVEGAAPGSSPKSEEDFFEAGDEGTYEGGPLSDVPELRLDHESAPAPPPVARRPSPVRAERARRGKVVVGAILALASAPLLIGLAQRLASRPDVSPAAEPTETNTGAPAVAPPLSAAPPAVPPAAPPASAAPSAPAVAPPPVSPAPPAVTTPAPAPASPAAAPSAPMAVPQPSPPSAAAPAAPTPAPAGAAPPRPVAPKPAVAQPAPAQPVAPSPPRATPPSPSAAPPAPRATKPPPRATKPAEAAPAPAPTRPAALPPLDIPVGPQLPKAGEKPPTASFPVR